MKILTIKTELANKVFEITKFIHHILEIENKDNTTTLTFSSNKDFEKFQSSINSLNQPFLPVQINSHVL